ncbi:uncharacterized protein LOC144636402 [Oculina patagonica]
MEDPTIYNKSFESITNLWHAVEKTIQEGKDPTQIINKYKKDIQDARLKSAETPSYFIMTINMGGKAKRDDRVLLSSTIMRTCFSSIIFCQEIPGHFARDVVKNCGRSGYGFAKTDQQNHAAILWQIKDFDGSTYGLKTTDTAITRIRERVQYTTDLFGRIVMVKLTCRKTSDVMLAVSWHGPHRNLGYTENDKINAFNGLITFLHEVCKENDIPSFLIGADFNLDTLDDNLEPGKNVLNVPREENEAIKVCVVRYELSPRQEKRATNRNYIRNKDNFVFFSKDNKIKVSWVRPFEIEDPTVATAASDFGDLTEGAYANVQSEMAGSKVAQVEEVLDHNPIIGVLQFLSGPAETRKERAKKSLSTLFKKLSV